MKKQLILMLVCLLPLLSQAAGVTVTTLRTEQQVDPMGLDTPAPRLGWQLESTQRNVLQTAYRILVASSPEHLAQDKGDLWDSGKVPSDASQWIPYRGIPLKSHQRAWWKVKSYTTRGETPWSAPARWGMGPMTETQWGGRWIGWDAAFPWDREDAHSRLSSRYLRTEFTTQSKSIRHATVHICGLGMYELFINGQRIGDQELAPAPTDYRRTVLYNSFDVTSQLAGSDAPNAIGVTLGNGRFYTMHQNYKPYKIAHFGYPKLRLNLVIEYTDGTRQHINTDEKWRLTAEGPIRSNNEYDGEIYDARMELGDWTRPGYDDSRWLHAQRVSLPTGTLRASTAPNMKVMQHLRPVRFQRYGDRYLVDFGQNTAGWVRIRIPRATAGDTLRIRYAERLKNNDTELDVENLRHSQSTDLYICHGRESNTPWSARFSYHGFQYAEITGCAHLTADCLTAEVVYDDVENNGTFECSNPVLNRICRNAWWGISSNYKGVPVDCPQRDERQPWLGDHAIGTWGESFLFNNGATYAKWADDIREAQREDGCIPDICPAYYNYYTSEMTWSSTFPVVCDMVYHQFGNPEPIRRNYAAIKRWLHHIRSGFTTPDGVIHADKYGDWCMPPESPELIHSKDPARQTDGSLIATAYYYKMLQLMAHFAGLQAREADAAAVTPSGDAFHLAGAVSDGTFHVAGTVSDGPAYSLAAQAEAFRRDSVAFQRDAAQILERFNARFLTVRPGTSLAERPHTLCPDSIFYGNNTVTANILPLAFDMVPAAYRAEVEKNLLTAILTTNRGHISSGVIGVNWLMRELTRMGRGDVAYLLAGNTTYPSYGYMIEKGATTIWELWNGDTANRWMNSCNHVMILGDLITWYFRDLAGFNPAQPGYKQIELKPDFSIPDLSYVRATHHTPYGLLASHWRKTFMRLQWDITVPCNTTAILHLPTTDVRAVKDPDIRFLRSEGRHTLWTVPSGTYRIDIPLDPSVGEDRAGIRCDQFLYEQASFPECHGATIAELPNGDLVASFFGGTKERNPDCCIWVCRKPKGATEWTAPQLAADGVFNLDDPHAALAGITDQSTAATAGPVAPTFTGSLATARRKACWNPVLFQVPGSDLLLFYKIGLKVADWTGWLVRSRDGGRTWSTREPLPKGFLGPIKNKPEYVDGRIICPSSTEGEHGWRIHFELSADQGKTWTMVGPLEADLDAPTNLRRPNATNTDDAEGGDAIRGEGEKPIYAIQPSILRHRDGRLQVLCRTRNARLATAWSSDGGLTWSRVTLTDVPNNNSGTDAVTLADGRHVLIYNDFSTLPGTPKGPRTPLCVALSSDGLHWRNVLTLENSPISQYSYPSIIQGRDGRLHAIYTWRRQRIAYKELDLSGL